MQKIIRTAIIAVLSISVGIAFATPLLLSDLEIVRLPRNVDGPKAEFNVHVVYANFTETNCTEIEFVGLNPIGAVAYTAVLNITNLSDYGAMLMQINCIAAENFVEYSSLPVIHSVWGRTFFVPEGVWLDGKLYNVTLVTATHPQFDSSFNLSNPEEPGWFHPFWIEGAQLYEIGENDVVKGTFMNMNGTWVDVTGRINTNHSKNRPVEDYVPSNSLLEEHHYYQAGINETRYQQFSKFLSIDTPVGEGHFDGYWAPHQSRLIQLSGIYNVLPFNNNSSIQAILQAGNVTLQTRVMNMVNGTLYDNNTNTLYNTMSNKATEFKQIHLTRVGDSYIYNNLLEAGQILQADKWGIEVFVKPES